MSFSDTLITIAVTGFIIGTAAYVILMLNCRAEKLMKDIKETEEIFIRRVGDGPRGHQGASPMAHSHASDPYLFAAMHNHDSRSRDGDAHWESSPSTSSDSSYSSSSSFSDGGGGGGGGD